ncbi:unnamed protein product [Gadus morhua 'NCC']
MGRRRRRRWLATRAHRVPPPPSSSAIWVEWRAIKIEDTCVLLVVVVVGVAPAQTLSLNGSEGEEGADLQLKGTTPAGLFLLVSTSDTLQQGARGGPRALTGRGPGIAGQAVPGCSSEELIVQELIKEELTEEELTEEGKVEELKGGGDSGGADGGGADGGGADGRR